MCMVTKKMNKEQPFGSILSENLYKIFSIYFLNLQF